MKTPPRSASPIFRRRLPRLLSVSICFHCDGSNDRFMVSCRRSSRSVIRPNRAARAASFCKSDNVTRPRNPVPCKNEATRLLVGLSHKVQNTGISTNQQWLGKGFQFVPDMSGAAGLGSQYAHDLVVMFSESYGNVIVVAFRVSRITSSTRST